MAPAPSSEFELEQTCPRESWAHQSQSPRSPPKENVSRCSPWFLRYVLTSTTTQRAITTTRQRALTNLPRAAGPRGYPTCAPQAKLYTAKKDKASGCEYVQPNGGGKPSWVLPGSRSVLSAQLPTRGSFVVITDPSPVSGRAWARNDARHGLAVLSRRTGPHHPRRRSGSSRSPRSPFYSHWRWLPSS